MRIKQIFNNLFSICTWKISEFLLGKKWDIIFSIFLLTKLKYNYRDKVQNTFTLKRLRNLINTQSQFSIASLKNSKFVNWINDFLPGK